MKKRIMAMLLVIAMCVGLLPISAFAAEGGTGLVLSKSEIVLNDYRYTYVYAYYNGASVKVDWSVADEEVARIYYDSTGVYETPSTYIRKYGLGETTLTATYTDEAGVKHTASCPVICTGFAIDMGAMNLEQYYLHHWDSYGSYYVYSPLEDGAVTLTAKHTTLPEGVELVATVQEYDIANNAYYVTEPEIVDNGDGTYDIVMAPNTDYDGTDWSTTSIANVTISQSNGTKLAEIAVYYTVGVPDEMEGLHNWNSYREQRVMSRGTRWSVSASIRGNGDETDRRVTWYSSDESVLRVRKTGERSAYIDAVGPGKATIYAWPTYMGDSMEYVSEDKMFTQEFTVVEAGQPGVYISMDMNEVSVLTGNAQSLGTNASCAYDNLVFEVSRDGGETWVGTNQSEVITILQTGQGGRNFRANRNGKTLMRIYPDSAPAVCAILEVNATTAVTGVKLNETEISMEPGATFAFQATVLPDAPTATHDVASNQNVRWEALNDEPIQMNNGTFDSSEANIATAMYPGEATVTVSSPENGASATATVNVVVNPTDITLAGEDEITIHCGETQAAPAVSFSAVTTPNGKTYQPTEKKVVWTSSNETVATVDQNGNVTAVGKGTATITASVTGATLSSYDAETGANVETAGETYTDSYIVNVDLPITEVSLPSSSYGLMVDNERTITASVEPYDHSYPVTYTWESSDETIATVVDGVVTGVSAGEAVITVTATDGINTFSASATFYVSTEASLPDEVKLTDSELMIVVGGNAHLYADVLPTTANQRSVTWSSADTSVVTVDMYGIIIGVGVGETTVTATTVNGLTASCIVKVIDGGGIVAKGIRISSSSMTVPVGSSSYLTAEIVGGGSTETLAWSIADESKASIEEILPGVLRITGLAEGATKITASVAGTEMALDCELTVNSIPVTGVTLEQDTLNLFYGDAGTTLKAVIEPADASNKNIIWTSSDETVATVDATGKVTGLKNGTTTITATTEDGGFTATCQVTVNIKASSVKLDAPDLIDVTVGGTRKLNATVKPAGALQSVIWTTDDESIATVSADGTVTGVAAGYTSLTVKTADGAASKTVFVNVGAANSVTGILLNYDKVEMHVKESQGLYATVLPDSATNKNIIWASSDPEVANVDNGKDSYSNVYGNKAGTATITATTEDGEFVASCEVTVMGENEPIIRSDNSVIVVSKGDDTSFGVHLDFGNGYNTEYFYSSNGDITFTVKDPSIAKSSSNGRRVIGAAAGVTAVVASVTYQGNTYSIEIPVVVYEASSGSGISRFTLYPSYLCLGIGGSGKLEVHDVSSFGNTNGDYASYLDWSIADESIATVDESGKVTAVAEGVTVLTATSKGTGISNDAIVVVVPNSIVEFGSDEYDDGCAWYLDVNGKMTVYPKNGERGILRDNFWDRNYNYTDSKGESHSMDGKVKVLCFDAQVVTEKKSLGNMFGNNSSIRSIDLNGFYTPNATNMSNLFNDCRYLEELDFGTIDTSKVTNMDSMFADCQRLQKVDLSGLDLRNVKIIDKMFYDCYALRELDLTGFTGVTSAARTLYYCQKLEKLTVPNADYYITEFYCVGSSSSDNCYWARVEDGEGSKLLDETSGNVQAISGSTFSSLNGADRAGVWKHVQSIRLEYDDDYGINFEDQYLYGFPGATTTLPQPRIASGYSFIGWQWQEDREYYQPGDVITFVPGQSYDYYYAIYAKNATVFYDMDGDGTEDWSVAPFTVKYHNWKAGAYKVAGSILSDDGNQAVSSYSMTIRFMGEAYQVKTEIEPGADFVPLVNDSVKVVYAKVMLQEYTSRFSSYDNLGKYIDKQLNGEFNSWIEANYEGSSFYDKCDKLQAQLAAEGLPYGAEYAEQILDYLAQNVFGMSFTEYLMQDYYYDALNMDVSEDWVPTTEEDFLAVAEKEKLLIFRLFNFGSSILLSATWGDVHAASITRGDETTFYNTIEEAVAAAQPGEIITILRDFTLASSPLVIDKNVVFYGANDELKTLTGDIKLTDGANIELDYVKVNGSITTDGDVTVSHGGVTGTIIVNNTDGEKATVTITDDSHTGDIIVTGAGDVIVSSNSTTGDVTIGGDGSVTVEEQSKTGNIKIGGDGDVTVEDDSKTGNIVIDGDGNVVVEDSETGNIKIGGKGDVTIDGGQTDDIIIKGDGEVTLTDDGNSGDIDIRGKGEVTVSEGSTVDGNVIIKDTGTVTNEGTVTGTIYIAGNEVEGGEGGEGGQGGGSGHGGTQAGPVASITRGDVTTEYDTLDEAFAASVEGDVIVILRDAMADADPITLDHSVTLKSGTDDIRTVIGNISLTGEADITLDHVKLIGSVTTESGDITLDNGAIVTGDITTGSGDVTIGGGSTADDITVTGDGNVTVEGGSTADKITIGGDGNVTVDDHSTTGEIVIKGDGTVTVTDNSTVTGDVNIQGEGENNAINVSDDSTVKGKRQVGPTVITDTQIVYVPSGGGGGGGSDEDELFDLEDEEVPLADLPFPFEDVLEQHWFYDDVYNVYRRGLMLGVAETLFAPYASCTRGMIATIVYRLEGTPEATTVSNFKDVRTIWYYDAINWGAEYGILLGFTETRFGPEEIITREQLVAILYRYATLKGYDTDASADITTFEDGTTVSNYAKTAMAWAVANGLILGNAKNQIKPRSDASRAEIAAVLGRFISAFIPEAEEDAPAA